MPDHLHYLCTVFLFFAVQVDVPFDLPSFRKCRRAVLRPARGRAAGGGRVSSCLYRRPRPQLPPQTQCVTRPRAGLRPAGVISARSPAAAVPLLLGPLAFALTACTARLVMAGDHGAKPQSGLTGSWGRACTRRTRGTGSIRARLGTLPVHRVRNLEPGGTLPLTVLIAFAGALPLQMAAARRRRACSGGGRGWRRGARRNNWRDRGQAHHGLCLRLDHGLQLLFPRVLAALAGRKL